MRGLYGDELRRGGGRLKKAGKQPFLEKEGPKIHLERREIRGQQKPGQGATTMPRDDLEEGKVPCLEIEVVNETCALQKMGGTRSTPRRNENEEDGG